jgi:hypothetical protein
VSAPYPCPTRNKPIAIIYIDVNRDGPDWAASDQVGWCCQDKGRLTEEATSQN